MQNLNRKIVIGEKIVNHIFFERAAAVLSLNCNDVYIIFTNIAIYTSKVATDSVK